jgi:hypothetical protein
MRKGSDRDSNAGHQGSGRCFYGEQKSWKSFLDDCTVTRREPSKLDLDCVGLCREMGTNGESDFIGEYGDRTPVVS